MMRRILFSMLVNSPTLHDLIGERVYEKGSVPEHPDTPFIMTRWSTTDRPGGIPVRVQDRRVEIWVYGPQNDFTMIERIMRALQLTLHRRSGVQVEDPDFGTVTLIESTFEGSGEDLEDPDYRAQLKVATYRVVGGIQ